MSIFYPDTWQGVSEEAISDKIQRAYDELTEQFGPPSCGSQRMGFRDEDEESYTKVPRNMMGVWHNISEHDQYEEGNNWPVHLAPCWWDGELSAEYGLPILRMILLDPWEDEMGVEDLPDWCRHIDGYQVGIEPRTGDILAFDYGM